MTKLLIIPNISLTNEVGLLAFLPGIELPLQEILELSVVQDHLDLLKMIKSPFLH
jgi:hypothetical protein